MLTHYFFFSGLLLKEKWEAFGLRLNHAQQQMKMTENALLFAFVEVLLLLVWIKEILTYSVEVFIVFFQL